MEASGAASGRVRRRSISRRLGLTDSYGLTGVGFSAAAVGTAVVLIAVLSVSIIAGSRTVGRTTCHNFSAETGFRTKFVVLNFFSGGTCLAQAPNGQWVLNTKVIQFVQAKP